MKANGFV